MAADDTVSIVVRAKNEAKLIGRCLECVFAQRTSYNIEVVLIDSGSTDETLTIARRFDRVRIRQIAPASFNYGGTLNEGIVMAQGRYIIALSAHCIPTDDNWLQRLIDPLEQDSQVAGSFSRQFPWPDCEPVECFAQEHTFGPTDYVQPLPGQHLSYDGAVYSNASACFRRQLALEVPFREVPWAEDRIWAAEMLRRGHRIVYTAASVVFHSHNRGIRDYYLLGKTFGRAARVAGQRPYRLRDFSWWGLKRAYWTFLTWRERDRRACRSTIKRNCRALGSICRVIARDLGQWVTYREPSHPTARGGSTKPSQLVGVSSARI